MILSKKYCAVCAQRFYSLSLIQDPLQLGFQRPQSALFVSMIILSRDDRLCFSGCFFSSSCGRFIVNIVHFYTVFTMLISVLSRCLQVDRSNSKSNSIIIKFTYSTCWIFNCFTALHMVLMLLKCSISQLKKVGPSQCCANSWCILLLFRSFCSYVAVFRLIRLFFISTVVGWLQCSAVLYMTDISNAINYCSPHLINNYCIRSFSHSLCLPFTHTHTLYCLFCCLCHSHSLALLFMSAYLNEAWNIHHIRCIKCLHVCCIRCGNFLINTLMECIANIALETLWIFHLDAIKADKCIQEIILWGFYKSTFHANCTQIFSVLLNFLFHFRPNHFYRTVFIYRFNILMICCSFFHNLSTYFRCFFIIGLLAIRKPPF